MRILFDHGTPIPLRRHLHPHVVDTAFERGWSTLSNGDLLVAAVREGYDVLITTDQSLRHQQHLTALPLGVVVLLTTSWPRLRSATEAVRSPMKHDGSRALWRLGTLALQSGVFPARHGRAARRPAGAAAESVRGSGLVEVAVGG
jgi:hypothetical protein